MIGRISDKRDQEGYQSFPEGGIHHACAERNRSLNPASETRSHEKEDRIETSEMQPFYLYGRLIAVLEQGARGHDDIQWIELYYPRGFLPWVGLPHSCRSTGSRYCPSWYARAVPSTTLTA